MTWVAVLVPCMLNYTDSVYSFAIAGFTYALWSSCEVDPPNSSCTDALSFTLPGTGQQSCISERLYGCGKSNFDAIQDALAGEQGCESVIQHQRDFCSRDEASETPCIEAFQAIADEEVMTTASLIQTNCTEKETCSPDCKGHLETFVGSFPQCCLNPMFNSTYATISGANNLAPFLKDNTLHQRCGVETPPLTCPTSGSLPFKGSTFALLLPLIIAVFRSKLM